MAPPPVAAKPQPPAAAPAPAAAQPQPEAEAAVPEAAEQLEPVQLEAAATQPVEAAPAEAAQPEEAAAAAAPIAKPARKAAPPQRPAAPAKPSVKASAEATLAAWRASSMAYAKECLLDRRVETVTVQRANQAGVLVKNARLQGFIPMSLLSPLHVAAVLEAEQPLMAAAAAGAIVRQLEQAGQPGAASDGADVDPQARAVVRQQALEAVLAGLQLPAQVVNVDERAGRIVLSGALLMGAGGAHACWLVCATCLSAPPRPPPTTAACHPAPCFPDCRARGGVSLERPRRQGHAAHAGRAAGGGGHAGGGGGCDRRVCGSVQCRRSRLPCFPISGPVSSPPLPSVPLTHPASLAVPAVVHVKPFGVFVEFSVDLPPAAPCAPPQRVPLVGLVHRSEASWDPAVDVLTAVHVRGLLLLGGLLCF